MNKKIPPKLMDLIKKKISRHWSSKTTASSPGKVRWWQSPHIMSHYNKTVSNNPAESLIDVAKRKAKGRTFEEGVSIGCGTGAKEMNLIKAKLVHFFHLFELSDVRIEEGLKLAKKLGISDRVAFSNGDGFDCFKDESVDFVHWNNSLHHMFDVAQAVQWSQNVLKVGGMFYMDDFIGPTRFQWSDNALGLINRIRAVLPDRYLLSPYHPKEDKILLDKPVTRPNPHVLSMRDPSEAADSGRILESVRKYFPDAEISLTGGVVYSLALEDIIFNYNEEDEYDKTLLDLLMIIDELFVKNFENESLYATALAIKLK